MIRMRVIFRLLAAIAAAVLASCIGSHEEFWIDSRGGGRGEIAYSLPAAALRLYGGEAGVTAMIDEFLRESPAMKRPSREVVQHNGEATVRIAFEFDSAMDLAEIAEGPAIERLPPAVAGLMGDVRVRIRGRSVEYSRVSRPGKALPGAAFMPASHLEGRLVKIIHLPAPATMSNATRVENGGRTLVWETPLAAAVRQSWKTEFKMDVPIPWSLVLGVALPLCLACGFVIVRLRKAR